MSELNANSPGNCAIVDQASEVIFRCSDKVLVTISFDSEG